MLPRVEYSVTAPASPEEVWLAFSDLSRLLGRGIYSEAVWTEGPPWQVGSRLRYVVLHPLKATVSALVTFSRVKSDTTRVIMTMDFVGESMAPTPIDVGAALRFYTHDALDTMLDRLKENLKTH